MRKILNKVILLGLVLSLGILSSCSSSSTDDYTAVYVNKKHDTAILLCSFGSTLPQPQETYNAVIEDYHKKYPNADIYMSFTSRTIIDRVYAEIGKAYAKPSLWLDALAKADYKNVYVQSLHIIPGSEYSTLMESDVKKNFMAVHPSITVAKSACLLRDQKDVDDVAKVLYNYYKLRLDKGEAVVFMGHGNPEDIYNEGNKRYYDLETAIQKLSGKKNVFIGTVDCPDILFGHVRRGVEAFTKSEGKKNSDMTISLVPLMSITGDHAQNDLLGGLEDGQTYEDVDPNEDEEYSWILKFQKLGFKINEKGSNITEKDFNAIGLADHQELRNIWLRHMDEAIANAEKWEDHYED